MFCSHNRRAKKPWVEVNGNCRSWQHAQCGRVDVTKRHACHTKWRSMSPSAMPATETGAASPGTKRATSASPVPQVPPATQSARRRHQDPHKVKVDVAKRHACHTNLSGVTGNQARHQSQPSAVSATPATQNARWCQQAPRLPRKVTVDVAKRHACHTNWSGVTGNQARQQSQLCRQAPRLPHKMERRHKPTPATQSARRCHQLPRLPHKVVVCEQVVCVWVSCVWE